MADRDGTTAWHDSHFMTTPLPLSLLIRETDFNQIRYHLPDSMKYIRSLSRALPTATSMRSACSNSLHTSNVRPRLSTLRPLLVRQTQVRNMWIQTETTPNQDALKFVPGREILGAGATSIEFLSGRDAHQSPLARKLFAVDGVKTIFYGPDFLTITKAEEAQWPVLKPEIFSLLMEYLSGGEPIMSAEHTAAASDTAASEDDDEIVSMIKELLDSRIRPAIQEDGGDIEYRGFEDGIVKLKLRGACRTCDSSTVTLKNGIESMLMHYVPEVESVEQVLDPEDEIAEQSFEQFEKDLAAKKAQSQGGIGAEGP